MFLFTLCLTNGYLIYDNLFNSYLQVVNENFKVTTELQDCCLVDGAFLTTDLMKVL